MLPHFKFSILFAAVVISVSAMGMDLPHPPSSDPALVGWSGFTGTLFATSKVLPPLSLKGAETVYVLHDGTKIPPAAWIHDDGIGRAFILANFGIFSEASGDSRSDFPTLLA